MKWSGLVPSVDSRRNYGWRFGERLAKHRTHSLERALSRSRRRTRRRIVHKQRTDPDGPHSPCDRENPSQAISSAAKKSKRAQESEEERTRDTGETLADRKESTTVNWAIGWAEAFCRGASMRAAAARSPLSTDGWIWRDASRYSDIYALWIIFFLRRSNCVENNFEWKWQQVVSSWKARRRATFYLTRKIHRLN